MADIFDFYLGGPENQKRAKQMFSPLSSLNNCCCNIFYKKNKHIFLSKLKISNKNAHGIFYGSELP